MATSPSGSQPSISGGKPGGPGQDTSRVSTSSHVVKRHKCDGVRRLVAHPHLPLYISGGQDGAVALWEWSHNTQVATVRPGGIFAKVNRIVFTQQGNKFGAGWSRCSLGVESQYTGCHSEAWWHFRQSEQNCIHTARKQVWGRMEPLLSGSGVTIHRLPQ